MNFFGEVLTWNKFSKFYHIIHYSKAKNPILYFTTNGTVYIHGHGDPGDPEISPGKGTIGGDLSFIQVADRLIKTGLPKKFAGKIKLYSCNSAVGGSAAFARLFAKYMRSKGYKSCTYYGYQGSISGQSFKDDENTKHKYVLIPAGFDKDGEELFETSTRVSAARVAV